MIIEQFSLLPVPLAMYRRMRELLVNDELECMWKEVVVSQMQLL